MDEGHRRRRTAPDAIQTLPGQVTHGAWSRHMRERFADGRTVEGRALNFVLQGLTVDCGPNLNTAQCLLLDRIKEKLVPQQNLWVKFGSGKLPTV